MTQPGQPGTRGFYRRLAQHVRPYWPGLLGLFVLYQVSAPLSLLAPLPLKIAVDSAIGGEPLPAWLDAIVPMPIESPAGVAALAVGLLLLVNLLTQLQSLGTTILSTTTSQNLVLGFRTSLFAHVQRLSLAYHDSKGSTESAYRISYDAPAIQFAVIDGVLPFVTSIISLVTIVVVTMRLDFQLALVGLAISPVLFLLSHGFRRPLRSKHKAIKALESQALSVVQEVLGSLRVVKAFGQEDREEQRFRSRGEQSLQAQVHLAFYEGRFSVLVGMTTAVGTAAALYIGVLHVQQGLLTIGGLLLIMAYLAQMYGPLTTISRKVASIQGYLASLDRAFALLDQDQDVPERPTAVPIKRASGAVSFRDVSFAYTPERTALRQVSFDLQPGTRLGISGTTGAGKTTIVNLLMRFYDPQGGQILLDGVDIRDYRVADVRAQFATVLQEPVLFSTTIGENIAYAKPGATVVEVQAAAIAANIHNVIMDLPEGYDTMVGERGMQLSGGERQRISLARAFLKDAPILILDEPTSSVDTTTESLIMEAMERLMRNRTTLMIAHRLSTLDHCDARLHVEHGRARVLGPDERRAVEDDARVRAGGASWNAGE